MTTLGIVAVVLIVILLVWIAYDVIFRGLPENRLLPGGGIKGESEPLKPGERIVPPKGGSATVQPSIVREYHRGPGGITREVQPSTAPLPPVLPPVAVDRDDFLQSLNTIPDPDPSSVSLSETSKPCWSYPSERPPMPKGGY